MEWTSHLPQVTDDGRVCPGMLSVQSHRAVLENNQVEGLIEPPVMKKAEVAGRSVCGSRATNAVGSRGVTVIPVVAFAVKEALGVAVQRLDGVLGVIALLRVVQGHEEGRFLNGVQGHLVLSAGEVGVASVGPRGSAKRQVKFGPPVQCSACSAKPTNCGWLCGATYLSPAVSAASFSSPGKGSEVSARILSICCSISRGNSSRPS